MSNHETEISAELERLKADYLTLKAKLARVPNDKEVRSVLGDRRLQLTFGGSAVSKLKVICGDPPGRFGTPKADRQQIMEQWGALVRETLLAGVSALPTRADWEQRRCFPAYTALARNHGLPWSGMADAFLEFACGKEEWGDVVAAVHRLRPRWPSLHTPEVDPIAQPPGNRKLAMVVEAVRNWTPLRRRGTEESYKVELRSYLERERFSVGEEWGDSNCDLIVEKSVGIELKKSPDQGEYDRLFGQIVRHLANCSAVVVVVCDVARGDQFNRFEENVRVVYGRLGHEVEVIKK